MGLSESALEAVHETLAAALPGAALQRIEQPNDRCIVLTWRLYPAGRRPETRRLLCDVTAGAARVHWTSAKIPNPPTPLAFAQKLRHDLQPAQALSVERPYADRVLVFTLATRAGPRRLVAELSGHHANVFLVDDELRILASLRPSASRRRDLRVGEAYVPPLTPDQPLPRPPTPADEPRGEAIHAWLDRCYEQHTRAAEHAARRAALARALRKRGAFLARKADRIRPELTAAEGAAQLRREADTLACHLHAVPPGGVAEVRLVDPCQPEAPPLVIALRPEWSAVRNMTWRYERAKRLDRARAAIAARLAAVEAEAAAVLAAEAALAAEADERSDEQHLTALETEARRAGWLGSRGVGQPGAKRRNPLPRLPYREYRAHDGTPIWVGRGGADNGQLTFRLARGNDLWLHRRGYAGSHVVVRTVRGRPTSRETLLDAAVLAAHFSKGQTDSLLEVDVTPVHNLRRARGAPPGQVLVLRSETLALRPDPGRLARLLATGSTDPEGGPPGSGTP